jgi:hypothetical protein
MPNLDMLYKLTFANLKFYFILFCVSVYVLKQTFSDHHVCVSCAFHLCLLVCRSQARREPDRAALSVEEPQRGDSAFDQYLYGNDFLVLDILPSYLLSGTADSNCVHLVTLNIWLTVTWHAFDRLLNTRPPRPPDSQ